MKINNEEVEKLSAMVKNLKPVNPQKLVPDSPEYTEYLINRMQKEKELLDSLLDGTDRMMEAAYNSLHLSLHIIETDGHNVVVGTILDLLVGIAVSTAYHESRRDVSLGLESIDAVGEDIQKWLSFDGVAETCREKFLDILKVVRDNLFSKEISEDESLDDAYVFLTDYMAVDNVTDVYAGVIHMLIINNLGKDVKLDSLISMLVILDVISDRMFTLGIGDTYVD